MRCLPRRAASFHLPSADEQEAEIEIEVYDAGEMPPISDTGLQTKAGWTPFAMAGLKAGGAGARGVAARPKGL